MSTEPISTKRSSRVLLVLGVMSVGLLGVLIWQSLAFPSTTDYRALIRSADRIEVRAFLVNDMAGGQDFLTLTDGDDIALLADSMRVTGLWAPLDELVANSFRIRIIGQDGTSDIIVRGNHRVRHGEVWHASIDPSLARAIDRLARKQGSAIPSWRSLAKTTTYGEDDLQAID